MQTLNDPSTACTCLRFSRKVQNSAHVLFYMSVCVIFVCICEDTCLYSEVCVSQYRGALNHIVPDRQSVGLNTKQQEAPLYTAAIQPHRTV